MSEKPLTDDEAEKAFSEAEPTALSGNEIRRIVKNATETIPRAMWDELLRYLTLKVDNQTGVLPPEVARGQLYAFQLVLEKMREIEGRS